jgi:cytochrome c oxidase assembly factor CtaG
MNGHNLVLVHMVRHVVLAGILPPLVWLIAPALIRACRPGFLVPSAAIALGRVLTHPATTWLAGTLTMIVWHVPGAFALAQRSPAWHAVEDLSVVAAGLLFWWPVIRRSPAAPRLPYLLIPLYLFAATLPCDALSAFLVFSDRVVYNQERVHAGFSATAALADQQAAGAFMWVAITFLYLVPAFVLTVHAVSAEDQLG